MPDNDSNTSTPACLLPVAPPEVVLDFCGTWPERANCRGEDPSTFFPAHGDPGAMARRACANCPVQIHCLEYAIAADEWGIWGGLDQEQRRALRDSADEPTTLPGPMVAQSENRERA